MSATFDVVELATTYANKSAQDILKLAFAEFGDDLWISFSGAEDVVLVDMAWKLNKQVRVFTLDTGRLHAETYRFIEKVRNHYGITIEVCFPDPEQVSAMVNAKGLFSFYRDGHELIWLDHLNQASADNQTFIKEELANREFMPVLTRISEVSSFATPSTWTVETSRGATRFVLKGEEDIRRISKDTYLISDNHGVQYLIENIQLLDKHSRRLLDRFL